MPWDRKLYPSNWEEIRANILRRSGGCCEGSPAFPDCQAINYMPHPVTGGKVVLTIAHVDHNVRNNVPDNLKAWCQRCHNTHDTAFRLANRRQKAVQRQIAAGQLSLRCGKLPERESAGKEGDFSVHG